MVNKKQKHINIEKVFSSIKLIESFSIYIASKNNIVIILKILLIEKNLRNSFNPNIRIKDIKNLYVKKW